MVLDSIWELEHEKAVNFLLKNPHPGSRVLLTTRMRGFRKDAAEVECGPLSREEALSLLVAVACFGEQEAAEVLSGPQRPHGIEVVEACGRLPITVAIAGGDRRRLREPGRGLEVCGL